MWSRWPSRPRSGRQFAHIARTMTSSGPLRPERSRPGCRPSYDDPLTATNVTRSTSSKHDGIVVQKHARQVLVNGVEITLTRTEFEPLTFLMEHPSRVIRRHEIITRTWGQWPGDHHVLEVHLSGCGPRSSRQTARTSPRRCAAAGTASRPAAAATEVPRCAWRAEPPAPAEPRLAPKKGPPAHLEELTYPCCIPALGEFGEVPPHEGSAPTVAAPNARGRTAWPAPTGCPIRSHQGRSGMVLGGGFA